MQFGEQRGGGKKGLKMADKNIEKERQAAVNEKPSRRHSSIHSCGLTGMGGGGNRDKYFRHQGTVGRFRVGQTQGKTIARSKANRNLQGEIPWEVKGGNLMETNKAYRGLSVTSPRHTVPAGCEVSNYTWFSYLTYIQWN